ncbi:UDP-N-acetylmuramate--alanine ligase [Pseudosulfitobacter sp. SM2401]|uniref:UDP-N-acetylmuramate--alanine ligase n=1 Tax=Pseudosulfitobacter sp. SM2401 TaxID=3350098 RepID=UPI0036F43E68
MRRQYVPGIALLVAAPILIVMIGIQVSPWLAIAAVFAFLSMFRNPLRYIWARLRGQNPEIPK